MDPSAQYAIIAAREAWADAGSPEVDGDRLGSVVSSGIGGIRTILDAWESLLASGDARRVLPMTVPMLMPNSPTAYVSLEFGARAGAHAARVRLRLGRRGHRLRRRHDPHRTRRRRHRRRHRGVDPPDERRRVRRVAHALAAQRRPRRAPRAPTTSTATASSSATAPASSSWRAPSTLPPAAPASTHASPASASPPTGTTSPLPSPSGEGQIRAMRAALEESGIAAHRRRARQRARDVDRGG